MQNLISDFLNNPKYKDLHLSEQAKGQCDYISKELKHFLSSNGISSTVIEGIGLIPPLHDTAHEDWQKFKGKDQKFLAHCVVKTDDNMVIDLTHAQFNTNEPFRIIPFPSFETEWKTIKTPKSLNN